MSALYLTSDLVAEFKSAIVEHGLAAPSEIVTDGKMHRYYVAGDRRGSRNGWYTFHSDAPPSGAFGSWRTGTSATWTSSVTSSVYRRDLSSVDRATFAK